METLGTLLENKAKGNKGKPYFYCEDQIITYESINNCANRMANAFQKMEISKGDHVAVMLQNCPEYLYCWFGLAKIGAVIVAMNTQLKGDTLKDLIEFSDCKLIVSDQDFLPQYQEIAHRIKGVEITVFDTSGEPFDAHSLNKLFNESPASPPPNAKAISDIDPLIITFTSGTTGLPKLVQNSHRAYIESAKDFAAYTEISSEDRIYTALPLYHANPQIMCILLALVSGGSAVVARKFSASRFWDDVRKYQATAFTYVGAILPILLAQPEHPSEKDHPAKKCFGGGAPKDVYDATVRRFGVEVLEFYGMSEAGAWNTINRPGKGKSGTIGQLRQGFEVKIFDGEDNELPIGKIGEIVVRPNKPYIMFDGYYKAPEETCKSSSNLWWHTGDLGKIDEDGYYYFCGRKKESIRRGGEEITPYDIEREINKHPAVAESAAFGISDPIMGEEIGVAVVLKSSQSLSPQELIAWCEPKLPKSMVPRYIEFIEELPKSASAKVQKIALKKRGLTENTWDRKKV
jgi:crotonobetaine/carnitine-CoA ligase